MAKKIITKDVEVAVDIEDFDTKVLLHELLERRRYADFDKIELGLFASLFDDEPLTDNLLDEQKMDIIRDNLDKRTLEEIEHFFGVNLPYHNK